MLHLIPNDLLMAVLIVKLGPDGPPSKTRNGDTIRGVRRTMRRPRYDSLSPRTPRRANRLYAGWLNQDPVDEIRHEKDPNTIYQLD